jgi:hypothetical protein
MNPTSLLFSGNNLQTSRKRYDRVTRTLFSVNFCRDVIKGYNGTIFAYGKPSEHETSSKCYLTLFIIDIESIRTNGKWEIVYYVWCRHYNACSERNHS